GGGLLDLARLGGGEGAQAALHLGFGNPGRAPNGAGRSRDAGCAGAGGGGLGHRLNHTLALGLDHDALGAAMRETLLDLPGTLTAADTQRFFTVLVAHTVFESFPTVSIILPSCPRRPDSLPASRITFSVRPPGASALCMACARPKAKPISSAVRQPNQRPPSGVHNRPLPRSEPSEACNSTLACPRESHSLTFSKPQTARPALRASDTDWITRCASPASTCATSPSGTVAGARAARENRFFA